MARNNDRSKAILSNGTEIEYLTEELAEGSEGIVHFTADHCSVIKFYKDDNDSNDPERKERIEHIINKYNPTHDAQTGDYWNKIYCWPDGLVVSPQLGVRMPVYPGNFFTSDGREKKLSWFVNSKTRKLLSQDDRGTWLGHLQMCILMARATRRLHSAGLAHSDLSYNNFLGDPAKGSAIMIDLDGLVVPGIHPPKIAGTPGLIAPEVLMRTAEPSIQTDLHALAILIYQTLLFRHPLRGPKINSSVSAEEDERLSLGEKALFIENPSDISNRPKTLITGYDSLGPYLSEVINQSFIQGLHDPDSRPTAVDWESALVHTADLIYPCTNPKCEAKWFVFGKATSYTCPFCRQKINVPYVPIIQFYKEQLGKPGNYLNEKHRLVVWNGLYLYKWHTFDHIWAGENADKTPQGCFVFHNNDWYLYNMEMDASIVDGGMPKPIPHNQHVRVTDGMQIKFSNEPHGRLGLLQFLKI